MQILRQGARGPQVKLLPRLINLQGGAPRPAEDGVFGPKTTAEVGAFQSRQHLAADGIVGPNTWRGLGMKVEIDHPVVLVAQPTNMTCWSAAATMLFQGRMSVGAGGAVTAAGGGLASAHANVAGFARAHGLTMHAPNTWSVDGLAALVRRGPLWVGGVQPLGWPTAPPSGHVVVIGSMWSNGHGDGRGTMLLIYDPWPRQVGSTYGVFYGDRIASSPWGTTYVLHR
jgi:hypothetical protein